MTPSKACAELIKSFEQCRLSAYMPTVDDVPTIGFGSTGADIHMGMKWSQEQADARFDTDLARFGHSVETLLRNAPTTQGMYDACVSFSYNVGSEAFRTSTLRRLHLEGDYEGAAGQFQRWTKQKGTVLKGLVRRRKAEEALYRSGIAALK